MGGEKLRITVAEKDQQEVDTIVKLDVDGSAMDISVRQ